MLVVIGSAGVGRGTPITTLYYPEEIGARYGKATVDIQAKWRLYDRAGKALYQKTVSLDGKPLPAYVSMNGQVYRWLTTEDESHTNLAIGAVGSGAGLVVSDTGLIITNEHIAAGWKTNYPTFARDERGQGVVFTVQPKVWNDNDSQEHAEHTKWLKDHSLKVVDLSNPDFRATLSWRPDEGGPVFANDQPALVGDAVTTFEGRNDALSVRFPGSEVTLEAHLVRTSNEADMAVLKIDPPGRLFAVSLPQNDQVAIGERVAVLSFPAVGGNSANNSHDKTLQAPMVTAGVIATIGKPTTGDATIVTLGETYQITLPPGSANSGSPVFDWNGDAIGLATYASRVNEIITYVVPIRYARDLMGIQ